MKRSLYFSPKAKKQFLKLDKKIQQRIKSKLEYYLQSGEPLKYAKKLIHPSL
jgi:mRNA-degrading endonuclease RelE of RelBE toxin-antitoxin system